MRRVLLTLLLAFVLLIAIGAGIALGIHWSGIGNDVTIMVDDNRVHGSVVAAALGAAGALIVGFVCLIVVAALASVAVIVPVAIVLALLAALVALCIGLSPLLVPVLLVVGVCALLSRRQRRHAVTAPRREPLTASPPAPIA